MWSRSMLVMIAQSVSKAFTASNRPPRPTSRITRSSGSMESSRAMASVVNSKMLSVISRRADSTASKCGSNCAASTMRPLTRQRSSKCTRCGLAYRPTR